MEVTNRTVETEAIGTEASEARWSRRIEPEWARSEWFRVWLKLARNECEEPERN